MKDTRDIAWSGNLFGGMLLSYLTAFGLLGALFYFGDAWFILANSRLLKLMIGAGIVRYHDRHAGFIDGIPDVEYYLLTQDPVNWAIGALAFGLILLYWASRALQFHTIARLSGIAGGMGDHARAFFYGTGVGQAIPFGGANLATTQALGTTAEKAQRARTLDQSIRGVEVFFFALVSLFLLGWNPWFKQLGSTLLFLGCVSYLVYGGFRAPLRTWIATTLNTIRSLPLLTFLGLFVLSVVSFQLIDWASYFISMAFTTVNVLVGVDARVMTMAIVCGYVARSIPFTPGGFGQFEWGVALGIWFGGSSLGQAATVAILLSLFRLTAILLLTFSVRVFFPVATNFRDTLRQLSAHPL